MSFDWSQYLNLAQELIGVSNKPSNEEAKMRAAISRAYYAAFCLARNFLENKDGFVASKGGSVHKEVRDEFWRSRNKVRRSIGWDLRDLLTYRTMADYDERFPRLRTITLDSIELSKNIISKLDRLR